MFKVKITVTGFLGDTERYPCHFGHQVGDTIIYDGEKFSNKFCSGVLVPIAQQVDSLVKMGPRYKLPGHYYPFWYAPVSKYDESMKKYDGLGYRNVFINSYDEPKYHMAHLAPKGAFAWPPPELGAVSKDVTVVCGDQRTATVFKLEAFDLADAGFAVFYYRRSMVLLNKVLNNPGVPVKKLLKEFTKDEIEIPYPALSQPMVEALTENLSLVGHVAVKDGKVKATRKGAVKFKEFKKSLTAEEIEALGI
jgi:uncharacterized repeat protein (TIGR04076 family)